VQNGTLEVCEITSDGSAAVLTCAASQPGVTATSQAPALGLVDRAARAMLLRGLASLVEGELTLFERGHTLTFGQPSADRLAATICVHDPAFYRRVLAGGSIGAAESFMDGEWTTDDLTAVIRVMARNSSAAGGIETAARIIAQPLLKIAHALRRNSTTGSRRNIAAHYDLGNDFFALWLDPTMAYSSAVFEHPETTLHEAQLAKFDHLCRKLDLKPGDHLLEIGCGWGGLAIHAATNYGCRVTAATISREQFNLATERVRQAGLEGRVNVVLEDYRKLTGQYDKLVSVEMIEAVGHRYLPAFFAACSRLLKPNGLMALQAITIADRLYDRYLRSVDFIQRYIFPGGHLPAVSALTGAIKEGSDLRLVHLEDRPQDYARTLAAWSTNFFSAESKLRDLGLDDRFLRMWHFYLAYCEGGFREEQIGLAQIVLAKPRRRQPDVG
jgi:cyclopropane-fatty-acyl-phospholipid synthase